MKLHLLCLSILLLSLSTSMAQRGGSQNNTENSGNADRGGDDDRHRGSFFGSLLFTLFIIGSFGFIASIVYYRYQVKKYRVVPFVPPTFCPKSIYPPVQGTHGDMELGGGDYRAPTAKPLIEF